MNKFRMKKNPEQMKSLHSNFIIKPTPNFRFPFLCSRDLSRLLLDMSNLCVCVLTAQSKLKINRTYFTRDIPHPILFRDFVTAFRVKCEEI